MREIIFRGRRVDPESKGRFVEGWLFMYEESLCIQTLAESEYGEFIFQIDPETVGQYTGLTDKDGTKIFGGDILRICFIDLKLDYRLEPAEIKAAVFWDTYAWVLEDLQCGLYTLLADIDINSMDVTVVGNIYDNPELLD